MPKHVINVGDLDAFEFEHRIASQVSATGLNKNLAVVVRGLKAHYETRSRGVTLYTGDDIKAAIEAYNEAY